MSNFDMRSRMFANLSETKKHFKIKVDILSNKLIREISKNGSRVLHITSDIEGNNELCLEGRYGICKKLPLKHLESMLKKLSPFGLQIDVVGIALPHSVNLGQVFRRS